MLVEHILPEEIELIDHLRFRYGFTGKPIYAESDVAPVEQLLKEWEKNKSCYLYKLLGENFILKKNFKYRKSNDELIFDLAKRESRFSINNEILFHKDIPVVNKSNIIDMIMYSNLATNRYDGESFEIEYEDNKKYRVLPGCKVSKALQKIASIYNLSTYEEFRIEHSQVLNQKVIEGELCLSIHPLDYITMSDNKCGWESCLSWMNYGDYRQGIVEMMNSPCVIVAYLSSKENMYIGWNNKKWRQLFFVSPDGISSIKSYPFYNDELTKTAFEWIKELAEKNLGVKYSQTIEYSYEEEFQLPEVFGDKNVCVYFETANMYNDFGCAPYHLLCLNTDLAENQRNTIVCSEDSVNIFFFYSGSSQCMICGNLHPTLYDEASLVCDHCQKDVVCPNCDTHLDEEDILHPEIDEDGNTIYYCPYCNSKYNV